MKIRFGMSPLALLVLVFATTSRADEGMFPVSDLERLDLARLGLEIPANEIFSSDPSRPCLVDAICRVNGCTGSFVSESGLIFTNHHCAYSGIQRASTAGNDYLKDGFQAATREQEVHCPGYEVRITQSWRDVSGEVMSAVSDGMDFVERTKAIERRRKELEKQAEAENPGARAEVAEMFAGKTYVLFLYTFIKDVRLVFAPPSSVGNFGGEVDNWEWPRHTGDFSFMRAYVAPDGSTATYSKDNVPFRPKRHLKIAAGGVKEGDFVFLLGYPGRTSRHKTVAYMEFERDVRLPFVVDFNQWQISVLEEASAADREVAIKHASRIKSLANTEKRSRGQLKGLYRTDIVERRAEGERKLQTYIDADPARAGKYGRVLTEIAAVYAEMNQASGYEMTLSGWISASRGLGTAMTIVDAAHERQRADLERESRFMDRNIEQTREQLTLGVRDWHASTERNLFHEMAGRFLRVAKPANAEKVEFDPVVFSDALFADSPVADEKQVAAMLEWTPDQVKQSADPFVRLALSIYPEYLRLRELDKEREGRLNALYGLLVEIKQQLPDETFVPDANGTLRMTFGRVEGYSPEDAVWKEPFTTFRGVIEKTSGEEPFDTPHRVIATGRAGKFGSFASYDKGLLPVNMLYSTDTTGGNSGSPVINARGELAGINFDRTFEATINDFAWNAGYSRSIGVDMRYALWITGTVFEANHLLQEMGLKK
jgi:Peptidase S46